jgi:anti-anti-sigma factor
MEPTMTTSELTSAVRRRGDVVVVDLTGDVNRGAEAALNQAWEAAVREHPAAVVLNFSGAGYINSTGIALIVGVLARARAAGIPLRAYGLTHHYQEIFEITRLADFVAITTDEDSAVGGAEGNTE